MKAADPTLTLTEIGRRFGVTGSAVFKVLNPDRSRAYNRRSEAQPGRREAKTQWDHDNYEKRLDWCECGLVKLKGSHRCDHCYHAVADVRRTLAEGMWADGWSLKSMAETFGVREGYFAVRRLKEDWDLPYRYKGTKRQRTAAA